MIRSIIINSCLLKVMNHMNLTKSVTALSIFCLLIIAAGVVFHAQADHKSGIVIILNGASASGKSTLQKEVQKLYSTPYLGIGLDTFFVGVLPQRFIIGPRQEGDIDAQQVLMGSPGADEQGNKLFTLSIGPVGDQVMHGMHHAIAAYAWQANNCIVDYIAYKKEWIPDLCSALKGLKVYLVGVDCALEILENREKARGRAAVEGHARSHYKTVHEMMDNQYDVRVDTGTTDAATCAKTIVDFIATHPDPKAFKNVMHGLK